MSSSIEVLQTPPTEPEIAAALDACRSSPKVHMIIRRLAFQRDRLLQEQQNVRDDLDSMRDSVLHGRGPLADMVIDNDITNAVLDVIDNYTLGHR